VSLPISGRPARLGARLSVMFALETAGMAAFVPLLSLHAREGLGLTPYELSLVFAVGPVTALIGPPLAGWLADRVMRAEHALSLASALRTIALVFAAHATSFEALLLTMGFHGLFFAKTGVLVSTIAFHHLPDARRLGSTRVFGTASWVITVFLAMSMVGAAPTRAGQLANIPFCFYAGAAATALQALYALTLPPTSPVVRPRGVLDALEALKLLRSPPFAVVLSVAVLYGALMQLNLMVQGLYFAADDGLRLSPAAAGRASTVSQALELLLFPFLGMLFHRFGIRPIVMIGIAAWPLRYGAYLAGEPTWLVVGAQVLHGANYVLGFTGLQVAVELMAPRGLRASAQAAFMTASSGIGNLLGQLGCGVLLAHAARGSGHDWSRVFLVPLLVGIVATVLTAAFVREPLHAEPAPGGPLSPQQLR
jgi:MFS family permease